MKNKIASKPIFFDLNKTKDINKLGNYLKTDQIQYKIDEFEVQLKEFFGYKNPTLVYTPNFNQEFINYVKNLKKEKSLDKYGKWVFFPWLFCLIHILDEKDFFKVRTMRNQNLIKEKEQEIYYNSVIGLGGLSVGNSVALSIVLQGGGRHFRLADFDTMELSNTNRIRAGIQNLGLLKVEVTARQIYELNPYAKIELFDKGLTKENIDKFFVGPPKLDIMIDELDNLAVKYLIREKAKKYKIPIVMGADNGDNAVVDVERYDFKKQPKFFHNRMGDVNYKYLNSLDKFGIGKSITKHIGVENVTKRMKDSLLEMGKTIVSWPQLGGAAMLNGSAVAYCVRKILNKEKIIDNRSLLSLDEKLIPSYNSKGEKNKRLKDSKAFKEIFGL